MRILYNSLLPQFKTPFGTVPTGEDCVMHIYLPKTSAGIGVELILENCEEEEVRVVAFHPDATQVPEGYTCWSGSFTMPKGLYYYWFRVKKQQGSFRLFRQGRETNMEAGEKWQVSFIPTDFTTPDYAKGAVVYQILPDRFAKSGVCDVSQKLKPFYVHDRWDEEPRYGPDAEGNWCNDFFGGNLRGIQEKLPYLQELGVEILYLNPVFMGYSNHRYDTADYKRIDPMLGTEEDFIALCQEAHQRGMRVILDGVFSHTGSNSVYFDQKHVFGHGAVSDPDSPYRQWYRFKKYPEEYDSWWGMPTLPNVEEITPSYQQYIIKDEDSVAAHWMSRGADGFRLDVVDELPDEFVLALKQRLRELQPDAMLIGEVWEDASNKRTYGQSRRYFVDAELDSTMNYPWRKAILDFVKGDDDGTGFGACVMGIAENYPPQVLACVMNLLGSHDTPRILTALADDAQLPKEEQGEHYMTPEQYALAKKRLRLASFLQFMLPGMASIYYGDEAGLEGFDDPFSRRTYPWGREDAELMSHFRALVQCKRNQPTLRYGDVWITEAGKGRIAFQRRYGDETACIYVNSTQSEWVLPGEDCAATLFGEGLSRFDGRSCSLLPGGYCVQLRRGEKN